MNISELTNRMVHSSSNHHATAARLMMQCLDQIDLPLVPPAVVGCSVARRFWFDGSASRDELEEARVACWEYLDEQGATTRTHEPEVAAVRAVICVLYADADSDDLGECLDFFNEMLLSAIGEGDPDVLWAKVDAVVDAFENDLPSD